LFIKLENVGSKSEGMQAYLQTENGTYILYRKGFLSINDSFFKPFNGKNVSVSGELQKDKYIMVKDVLELKRQSIK